MPAAPTRALGCCHPANGTRLRRPIGPCRAGTSPLPSMRMLRLPADCTPRWWRHCLGGLPDEACGLLGGDPARERWPAAIRLATGGLGQALHRRSRRPPPGRSRRRGRAASRSSASSTPTPTPTPIRRPPTSPRPPTRAGTTCIVSLRDTHPTLRSYRILGDVVDEELVVVDPRSYPDPAGPVEC